MASSIFSSTSLARFVRAGDPRRFDLDFEADREAILKAASDAANNHTINLTDYNITTIRKKRAVSYSDYSTNLCLRAVAHHVQQRLRIVLPSRDRTAQSVIETLLDATPMHIIRRDIRSFYETIPAGLFREGIIYDVASASLVREYLTDYFTAHVNSANQVGLPRGIGLSAILAEHSMRDFDKRVKAIPGVYRYFRYADDIIIFATNWSVAKSNALEDLLPKGMTFSLEKSQERHLSGPIKDGQCEQALEYLGYEFSTENRPKFSSRKVLVKIAEKKVKRLKSRLVVSFKDFLRNKQFGLLQDRAYFLSSNYRVSRSGNTFVKHGHKVHSGLFYNYRLCGTYSIEKGRVAHTPHNCSELKAVDGFYRALIRRSLQPNGAVVPFVTSGQIQRLKRISFFKGYSLRMAVGVTQLHVTNVRRVWRNV